MAKSKSMLSVKSTFVFAIFLYVFSQAITFIPMYNTTLFDLLLFIDVDEGMDLTKKQEKVNKAACWIMLISAAILLAIFLYCVFMK